MSRVYFHSEHGEAELRGSERAWLAWIASGPAQTYWAIDRGTGFDRAREIVEMIPKTGAEYGDGQYLIPMLAEAIAEDEANKRLWAQHDRTKAGPWPNTSYAKGRQLVQALETALRVNGFPIVAAGVTLQTANIELNTALALGSEPLALAAKIHGWCESFCWVDGPDRKWMADVIDDGLDAGIYRRGLWYTNSPNDTEKQWSSQGWEECTALLRSRDDGPVVLSYSVCDQFPDVGISPLWPEWPEGVPGKWDALSEEQRQERERIEEEWYELSPERQWELGMEGLRAKRPWAQLSEETLFGVTFSHNVTIFDLFAPDRDERIRAAVAP